MPKMLRETKRSFACCSRGGKSGAGIEVVGKEDLKLGLGLDLEFLGMLVLGLAVVFFWMMDRVSLRKMRVEGLWYPGHWKPARRHCPQEGIFLSHCGGLINEIYRWGKRYLEVTISTLST
jgi:hypothetical protein